MRLHFLNCDQKEFKNVLKIYLDEKPDTYKIASNLEKLFLETNVNINEYIENKNCISYRVVENEDWSKKWKENWKPFNITDKIVICPSWEEYQKKKKEIVIKIDPSNAFGTGVHATTSLCAKKIEEYLPCKLKTNPNLNLLDLGTGSGILSIIASILGCKDVLGVDIDESVIKTAIDNVNMNHVKNVKICEGTAKNIIGTYDIIVANILHNIIIKELDVWKKLLKKDGIMILSGILDEKKELVLEKIKELNLKVVSVEQKKEWVCICVEG
ncbi:MAG: 50S ribosomal protein L11 methyltransferase [Candidatus Melainabacteria bacterium]|nr:MAG: 50S ribosomal protein L11 methyltransferase [Candidatus Melainabacteria bacterium]